MLADLRHAGRMLRRSPALAAIAIVSLALGIGANITVYSVVREMILDEVSAARPDRLVRMDADLTYTQYRQFRAAGAFQDVAFETGIHDAVWQRRVHSEVVWVMDTSANFFEVLGVAPAAGRLFGQHDEGMPVAVVTHRFWRTRLGADTAAIGRTLQINGRLLTLAGVLPRNYRSIMGHGVSPEIFAPAKLDTKQRCGPIGRLRDGVTRRQMEPAVAAAARPMGDAEFVRRMSTLRPLSGFAANAAGGGDDQRFFVFFVMLFGVAGALGLIACSNVAGLLLARGASRSREMAIRKALGANRRQLARPLLAEGLLLGLGGAAAGFGLDAALRGALASLRWPTAYNIPIEFHFQSDGGLLLYGLLSASAAFLISSLPPALRETDLSTAMKPAAERSKRRVGFVAFQVVISTVLLVLGSLFSRGLIQITHEPAGFDADHIVIAAVHPRPGQHRGEEGWPWRDRLVRSVEQIPGVTAVSSTDLLPLMGEAREQPVKREGSAEVQACSLAEGERYFATMGIPILRGRDFEAADRTRNPMPAIVNRTLALRLFGNLDAIGARLVRGPDVVELIGIAEDSRIRTLGEGRVPAFYTPDANGQLLVRVAGDPKGSITAIREALARVDSESALDVRPMRDAVVGALFPMRVAAGFIGALSALGLLLALVGLYGSVSFTVARRTREMGIRAALGATRGRILWTVVRESAVLVAAASAVGLVLAVFAVRPVADLMPAGLDAWNPVMFGAVAALLTGTSVAAAAVPARRASTVDPAIALREE